MASVIEQAHDDYGPIWPMSIAPYHVHICALNPKKPEVREAAEKLYDDLTAQGVEVLYDDRGEKAGFMFNDADLIGVPVRLIVSPKTVEAGQVEFKLRGGSRREMIDAESAVETVVEEVKRQLAAYECRL